MQSQRTDSKRGGQPGNLNALKHGFYSRQFSKLELSDIDAALDYGLDNEIAMLRVVTRRVFDLAQGFDDLTEATQALGALGLAAARLSGLLRIQSLLEFNSSDTNSAISRALSEVISELKLDVT
jgi:hypothetical protein